MAYASNKSKSQAGTMSMKGKSRPIDGATTSPGVGRDAKGCPTADWAKAGANVNTGHQVGNYHAGKSK